MTLTPPLSSVACLEEEWEEGSVLVVEVMVGVATASHSLDLESTHSHSELLLIIFPSVPPYLSLFSTNYCTTSSSRLYLILNIILLPHSLSLSFNLLIILGNNLMYHYFIRNLEIVCFLIIFLHTVSLSVTGYSATKGYSKE